MSHQNEHAERGFPMMKSAVQKVFAGARVARVIVAMSGLLAITACQDAVAPDKAKDPIPDAPLMTQNTQSALQMLGTALPYSTQMFVASVTDATAKARVQNFLNTLQSDLLNNKTGLIKQDVANARSGIAAAPASFQADLAAISVALDQIDLALTVK